MHKHRGYDQPQEKSFKVKTSAGWTSSVINRMEESRDTMDDDDYLGALGRAKEAE